MHYRKMTHTDTKESADPKTLLNSLSGYDLSLIFGSLKDVQDVLEGTRDITLPEAQLLAEKLKVPVEVFL